jgi:hypothetical protein
MNPTFEKWFTGGEKMNTQFDDWFKDESDGLHCDHEFKKSLSKSGMYYIRYCHKCESKKPWHDIDELSDEAYERGRFNENL